MLCVRYDIVCPNEIPSDYKAYRKQQRRWSCGPMQLWAAARQSVSESSLPPLHKAYLNIFFFGVRMLATNVISFTFYSVLVPMILLVYATEDLESSVHHRFMPWWAIVWMPMLVTMSTMAFSPNSFHYMLLYVMYENAMSILKLGASLEGLLGLKGSMTWTVTQKLGAQASQSFDLQKCLKKIEVFFCELFVGFFLIAAAMYGFYVGASWVFTVYFFTQGVIFLIFALSLVEVFNLQPPPEAELLGLRGPMQLADAQLVASVDEKKKKKKKKKGGTPPQKSSTQPQSTALEDESEGGEESGTEGIPIIGGIGGQRKGLLPSPPSLVQVLRANAIIFLYTLPINAFSILCAWHRSRCLLL